MKKADTLLVSANCGRGGFKIPHVTACATITPLSGRSYSYSQTPAGSNQKICQKVADEAVLHGGCHGNMSK